MNRKSSLYINHQLFCTNYYLFIKYYSPLHVSSLKCSSSGGYSYTHAAYGTVTLYESSWWLVGTQLEWELTGGGRLLVGVLRYPPTKHQEKAQSSQWDVTVWVAYLVGMEVLLFAATSRPAPRAPQLPNWLVRPLLLQVKLTRMWNWPLNHLVPTLRMRGALPLCPHTYVLVVLCLIKQLIHASCPFLPNLYDNIKIVRGEPRITCSQLFAFYKFLHRLCYKK